MGTQTLASTVLLWREHFLMSANVKPKLTIGDYRLNWAMLQNDAEGRYDTAKSASLVHKYLKLFKAEAEAETVKVVDVPHSPDTMTGIEKAQKRLSDLMKETLNFTRECKYLAEVIDKTQEILNDNQIITDLTTKANKLQAEVNNLKLHVAEAEAEAKQEREWRNRPIHGEATR